MITTTYKCDHCGHEQNSKKQMWEIGISLNAVFDYSRRDHHHIQLWCRPCLEKIGLLPEILSAEEKKNKREEETKNPPTPITLEDIIREIVREEVGGE